MKMVASVCAKYDVSVKNLESVHKLGKEKDLIGKLDPFFCGHALKHTDRSRQC